MRIAIWVAAFVASSLAVYLMGERDSAAEIEQLTRDGFIGELRLVNFEDPGDPLLTYSPEEANRRIHFYEFDDEIQRLCVDAALRRCLTLEEVREYIESVAPERKERPLP